MPNNETPMLRVKAFAKIEEEQENNVSGNGNIEQTVDIEIISLSSEEEKKPVAKKQRARKKLQTPKIKTEKPERLPPSTGCSRRFRTPLKHKYHKISEYFSSTKKEYKVQTPQMKPKSLNKLLDAETPEIVAIPPPEKTEVQRLMAESRSLKVVLRRLSIDKKVETKRTRDKHEDQSKLSDFIKYEPIGDSYYKTHQKSTFPTGTMVRIEDMDLLQVKEEPIAYHQIDDEMQIENIITIDGSSSLRPLQMDEGTSKDSIYDGSSRSEFEKNNNNNVQPPKPSYNLRKKSNSPPKLKAIKKPINKTPKLPAKQLVVNKQKRKIECPAYKIVEGTKLAVDAFRYGDIDGVEHYFLSHFHGDHYIGLKKSFNHTLYVSNITGRLVQEFIKVDPQYMKFLDINTPIVVDGVEVTAVDANHCPGAVMFLFKLSTGKCLLHTGDFRASPDMEEYPEFWNNDIHTIYLDTTYLSSRYEFLTQSDSIQEILTQCHTFVREAASSSGKPLIICGAYKVGKEKVWLRIAQEFEYKVWVDKERYKAMQCIQNKDILDCLTRFAKDANIHILPLGSLSYQFVAKYVEQFGEEFCKILAIRPSGWEKNASKPTYRSRISILGIQYSEHSTYNELRRFVRFLRPEKVISTVPFSNKNVAKTPTIPDAWLSKELLPKPDGQQRNIKDFLVTPASKRNLKRKSIEVEEKDEVEEADDSRTKSQPPQLIDELIISDMSDDFML